jgi:hypothetical protein
MIHGLSTETISPKFQKRHWQSQWHSRMCTISSASPCRIAFLFMALKICIVSAVCNAQSIDEWVEQLASPNPAPTIIRGERDDVKFIYSPNYDHQAQKRVGEAWDTLIAKNDEALPYLVKHFQDDRYSFTEKRAGHGGSNLSVGFICQIIFESQIEVYESHVPYEDRWKPHFVAGLGAPQGLQPKVFDPWWSKHQHKNLHTLQIEAVTWAIEHEQSRSNLSENEKLLIRTSLNSMLERLKSSEKPICVNRHGEGKNKENREEVSTE